jgi:hypothetical protein
LRPRFRRRLRDLGVDLGERIAVVERVAEEGKIATTKGTPRSRQSAPICLSARREAIQPGASSAYIDL